MFDNPTQINPLRTQMINPVDTENDEACGNERKTQLGGDADHKYCTYLAANFYMSAAKDNIRSLT
jgi:hypothetical protein